MARQVLHKPTPKLSQPNCSKLEFHRIEGHYASLPAAGVNQSSDLALHGHQQVFGKVAQNSVAAFAKESRTMVAQSPDPVHVGVASDNLLTPELQWILYALLNDRQNMVQFVTRNSHVQGKHGPEVPLITQLQQRMQHETRLTLNDRFSITSITVEEAGRWINDKEGGVGLKKIAIHIEDSQNVANPRSVQLTQVAPPFVKQLLKSEDLQTVHHILKEQHVEVDSSVVFSYAGVGRNASLTVYDQLCKGIESGAIQNSETLEQAMKDLVESGKQIRSEHFVQSAAQMHEIYKAALKRLQTRLLRTQQSPQVSNSGAAAAVSGAAEKLVHNTARHITREPAELAQSTATPHATRDAATSRLENPAPDSLTHAQGQTRPSVSELRAFFENRQNATATQSAPVSVGGITSPVDANAADARSGSASLLGPGSLPFQPPPEAIFANIGYTYDDDLSSLPPSPTGSRRASLNGQSPAN